MVEQAKFTYSPRGKSLEKQTQTIKVQRRNQIDASKDQNRRLAVLTNEDDKGLCHKEIFEKAVKERFDEIIDLSDEINPDDLIYYFKGEC